MPDDRSRQSFPHNGSGVPVSQPAVIATAVIITALLVGGAVFITQQQRINTVNERVEALQQQVAQLQKEKKEKQQGQGEQKEQQQPATTTNPAPAGNATGSTQHTTTTGEIDTSDWKTYRNEEFGFAFEHPPDWHVQRIRADLGKNEVWRVSPDSIEDLSHASQYKHSYVSISTVSPERGAGGPRNTQSNTTTVDGVTAQRTNFMAQDDTFHSSLVTFDRNEYPPDGMGIRIRPHIQNEEWKRTGTGPLRRKLQHVQVDMADKRTLDRILSTFRFLE